MKHKLTSLRLRMFLPVIVMTLFVVILLTTLFSRAYISMILKQEQEINTVGFETVSRSITPLVEESISATRSVMLDERFISYARLQYASGTELIHGRISFRDYLRARIAQYGGIYGLLFMRKDGSMFGTLPEGNLFFDQPEENPFPEEMIRKILDVPLGQLVWTGPVSGADIYGFENEKMPQSIMIAAWKSVDVSYGECYAMMLMDESVFEGLFSSLRDGKSTWHLFAEDQAEIYHTGQDECLEPDRLISESNSGTILRDENGHPVCTFSMTIESPAWTLVREVSMEDYEQVVSHVRQSVAIFGVVILLIALAVYQVWLKKYMLQFDSLLNGVIRMGEGDLESTGFVPTTINEFLKMQQEINRTRLALSHQMDTIRQMEREQKDKEIMIRELSTAREIQKSAIPHTFPPFPERKEIDLFASMDPARDVGGDFYDFFFIDEDHLCLVIADVSGKGVPAALFMMVAKRVLEDSARLEYNVSEILEKANESLCDNNQAEMFVTVWLGILEITTGKLTAANAGHEYPMIYRKNGSFELHKDRHGFVLGGMPGVHYVEYGMQLNPGDKIFVYTDGVPEATADHGEMFGTDHMLEALNTCRDGSVKDILSEVKKAVDDFVGEAEQFDDLTMLCLEYKGMRGLF